MRHTENICALQSERLCGRSLKSLSEIQLARWTSRHAHSTPANTALQGEKATIGVSSGSCPFPWSGFGLTVIVKFEVRAFSPASGSANMEGTPLRVCIRFRPGGPPRRA